MLRPAANSVIGSKTNLIKKERILKRKLERKSVLN